MTTVIIKASKATSKLCSVHLCVEERATWHRLLRKSGSPFCPGELPGRRHLWALAACGSARSGCQLGSESVRKDDVRKRKLRRRRKRKWRREAAGVAPEKALSGPP